MGRHTEDARRIAILTVGLAIVVACVIVLDMRIPMGCWPYTRPGFAPSPPINDAVIRLFGPLIPIFLVGSWVALGAQHVSIRLLGLVIVAIGTFVAFRLGLLWVGACTYAPLG